MIAGILNPSSNLASVREIAALVRRYRGLIVEMTRRELIDQFAGHILGRLWAVLHPLLLMGLFVFIFGFVFNARIGGTHEMPLDYTTYLLSGLIPWLAFQQGLARATTVLVGHANLVKQVVFPIEILPFKVALASLLPALVGFFALLIYVVATHGAPFVTYLLLPLVLLVQFIAMLGLAFLLAAIGAFLRDTKDFIQVFATYGAYVLPIFYLPDWVPAAFKPFLYMNPFSYMVWCYQDALYFGRFDHPWAWVIFVTGSFGALTVGYRAFRRLKPQFGNVL